MKKNINKMSADDTINHINDNKTRTDKDYKLQRKQRLKRIKEIRDYYNKQRNGYYKDNHIKILEKRKKNDRY